MNTTKLITITALAVCMLPQAALGYSENQKLAADFLAYNEIIVTQEDQQDYKLDSKITRREMAKVTLNLSEKTVGSNCKGTFSDMNSDDWGCKYAEAGVTHNFFAVNSNFRPSDSISKIEALKMIMQGRGIEKELTDDWREGYISVALKAGLLEESFTDYDTLATRGWIFEMAQHAIEYSSDEMIEMLMEILDVNS